MKLSESQRRAVLCLLSYMTERDTLSLGRTVTNNLVSLSSPKDAQEAILLHEIDIQTFLSRKKVTRDLLFKYLHDNRIDIPGNSDKSQLIDKLLQVLEVQQKEIQISNCQPQGISISQENINVVDVNTLAEQFSSWFYGIMNDYFISGQSDKLCVEHFWNDCSLHLVMESSSESVVKDIQKDSESVVSILRELQMQHKLYFNPNISSSGVRGRVDAHGLVLVMTCGTLHQMNNCVGIFHQVFGLVRDPFMENNWRIKSTNILLKSEEISKLPSLEHECFNSLPLPQ